MGAAFGRGWSSKARRSERPTFDSKSGKRLRHFPKVFPVSSEKLVKQVRSLDALA